MPIDTETPRSPGWWLNRLHARLEARRVGETLAGARPDGVTRDARAQWLAAGSRPSSRMVRPGLDLLADYAAGDPPLPIGAEGWRDAVRHFLRLARLNMADLVVTSALDRMVPVGWATAEDDRDGDELAARIADEVEAGALLADALEATLTLGDSYVIVGPRGAGVVPLITHEDPRQVITAEDSATGATLAGLKIYQDEWTGTPTAVVYLPGEVWTAVGVVGGDWEWDAARTGPLPSQFAGVVPVVRVRNRRGRGEFEAHLDLLDRINHTILQRLAVTAYQAFRQRAVIGLETEDEQGQPVDYDAVFTADPGAFWSLPAGAAMWESGVVDLTPIRMAIRDDLQDLAAVTRTPLFYLSPDAANGSAEGASLMREGLVYRVEDRRRRVEPRLARVMRLAFLAFGDEQRARASRIRTLWQSAERFSLSERMSAAAQARAAGLPQEMIWTDTMGYAPGDLGRLQAARGADTLFLPPAD